MLFYWGLPFFLLIILELVGRRTTHVHIGTNIIDYSETSSDNLKRKFGLSRKSWLDFRAVLNNTAPSAGRLAISKYLYCLLQLSHWQQSPLYYNYSYNTHLVTWNISAPAFRLQTGRFTFSWLTFLLKGVTGSESLGTWFWDNKCPKRTKEPNVGQIIIFEFQVGVLKNVGKGAILMAEIELPKPA